MARLGIVMLIWVWGLYALAATSLASKYWPQHSTVHVHFMDGNLEQKQFVTAVIHEWLQHINLNVQIHQGLPNPQSPSHIRISVRAFRNWSTLGTDALHVPLNRPTLVLGVVDMGSVSDTERRRVILHEFGHVLGLIHEQLNPEFPYRWVTEEIKKWCGKNRPQSSHINCFHNITGGHLSGPIEHSKFDPSSIMMYAIPKSFTLEAVAFSKNSLLSAIDVAAIRQIYPLAGK